MQLDSIIQLMSIAKSTRSRQNLVSQQDEAWWRFIFFITKIVLPKKIFIYVSV